MTNKKEIKKENSVQNVLSVDMDGEIIVSNPFDFEAACLVDDMRYSVGDPIGLMHLGKKAVNYMFIGTKLTDDKIESLSISERRRLCEEAASMYFSSLVTENSPKNE